ncbi:MAG: [protein-PII] uridylyltransferase [Nitrospinae bacterium]|nr:[protein-PII] uridylyltransferase [Nitrospinota bacterium]
MLNIKELREKFRGQREAIFAEHRGGAGGLEIVRKLTECADNIIMGILDQALKENPAEMSEQPFAVVGVGGYGRSELCPGSDIDLLTLHESGMARSAEYAANILVPALWDIGYEVGHVFRAIHETIEMSKKDMTVKTNLIQSRLVWGDGSLYIKFRNAQWENTVRKDIESFMQYLEEMRKTTSTRPLGITQPNIKQDAGGLRALQTAFWAAYARFGIHDPTALRQRGILTEKDLESLEKSLDFLLRVRNELHFNENKKNDSLAFEVQQKTAAALGYQGQPQEMVKHFMGDYYRSVKNLKEISDGLFNRSRNYRKGIYKKSGAVPFKKTEKGLTLFGNEIFFSGNHSTLFKENPELILDIFRLCQDEGHFISLPLQKKIQDSLDFLDPGFFSNARFREFFISVLKKRGSTTILRMMHESGVLSRFLPEFEEITHATPYDSYHAYTIDEHTFQALSHLEALENEKSGTLPEIYKRIEENWLVKLVILHHDIGKPEEEQSRSHSQVSAKIAEKTCAKLALSEMEMYLTIFLIKHHLLLNHLARRRDTHDSKAIHGLADTIGNRKKLDMLYLVTYADMQGVAPGVWSNWSAFLLEDLYQRTADFLNIDESDRPGDEEKVEAQKKKILKYLPREIPMESALDFLETAPTRYLNSVPIHSIIGHISLSASIEEKKPAVGIYNYDGSHFTEMVLLSESRRGNLNRVAGVLSSRGINILETKIFRKKDGTSIDIFRFIDRYGKQVGDNDQLNRIKQEVIRVVWNKEPPTKWTAQKNGGRAVPLSAPRVEIKNNVTPANTVIEIEADDRIGLVQSITFAIYKMGLNIHLAKIDTEGNKAIDAFYVTDENDRPVHDENFLRELKKALLEVI